MNKTAVFLLSDTRSGSTLLDQCLGAHPRIASLGEVHWIAAYAEQDRSVYDPAHPLVCSCGLLISECPFWTRVEHLVGQSLATLEVRAAASRRSRDGEGTSNRKRILSVAAGVPAFYRMRFTRHMLAGSHLARDCIRLYDAVSKATGRDICVDSSKSAIRFRAIYEENMARARAIVLTRDARAVVYSKMKRGRSVEEAANGWRRKMKMIESLMAGVPKESFHVLKYEALCEDAGRELSAICRFLGVEFSDAMLRRPTENLHTIGGSPSKFDKDRIAIKLDRSFETHLGVNDRRTVERLVGGVAGRWGY